LSLLRPHPKPTLFPYTTLFRSRSPWIWRRLKPSTVVESSLRIEWMYIRQSPAPAGKAADELLISVICACGLAPRLFTTPKRNCRSEEHTSELQSRENLVCRLLL